MRTLLPRATTTTDRINLVQTRDGGRTGLEVRFIVYVNDGMMSMSMQRM